MNLPPDKVRLLRSYDNEKKWELICDQVGYNYMIRAVNTITIVFYFVCIYLVVFGLCRSVSR